MRDRARKYSSATSASSAAGWRSGCELPSGELRRSRLPSGWTPLELLKHLTYVEMRWLERLRHIRSLLPSDSITGEPKLLLFSRQGFTPELTGEALSRPDVAPIDLHRLYHGS